MSALLLALPWQALAAEPHGVLDAYYGPFARLVDPQLGLIEDKGRYPGLTVDTCPSVCGAGYEMSDSRHAWDGLYARSEGRTPGGRLGAWLGNVGLGYTRRRDSVSTQSQPLYQGTGLVWAVPKGSSRIVGASLTFDGSYSGDYRRVDSSLNNPTPRRVDRATRELSVAGAATMRPSRRLAIVVRAEGSGLLDRESEWMRDLASWASWTLRSETHTLSGSASAEFVLGNSARMHIGVGSETVNRRGLPYYLDPYSSTPVWAEGHAEANLGGSLTKKHTVNRFTLYNGINADLIATFPAEAHGRMALGDVLSGVHPTLRRSIDANVSLPFTCDVHLRGSVYAFVSIVPALTVQASKPLCARKQSVDLTMQRLSTGLRGHIGERLRFALTPSLSSSGVYFLGLEAAYEL